MDSRITQVDISQLISRLPNAERFHGSLGGDALAVFICTLGFEERCLKVPTMLASSGAHFDVAVVVTLDTNTEENALNHAELKRSLDVVTDSVEIMDADDNRFSQHLKALLNRWAGEHKRIILDISSFASRALLKVVNAVLQSDGDFEVLYCEANEYKPTQDEYAQEPQAWQLSSVFGLERGVSSVQAWQEYPGFHPDPLPDLVILLPNLNPGRSMAVVTAVDASIVVEPQKRIVWIVGIPLHTKESWRAQAVRQVNSVPQDARVYEASTFEYKELLPILMKLHEQNAETHRMTLSPLGSKLQSLAIGLFLYMKPDVRVMFSIPKEYNAKNYSLGVREVWRLTFGNIASLRKELDTVGILRML